jgi:hypothetical protein
MIRHGKYFSNWWYSIGGLDSWNIYAVNCICWCVRCKKTVFPSIWEISDFIVKFFLYILFYIEVCHLHNVKYATWNSTVNIFRYKKCFIHILKWLNNWQLEKLIVHIYIYILCYSLQYIYFFYITSIINTSWVTCSFKNIRNQRENC